MAYKKMKLDESCLLKSKAGQSHPVRCGWRRITPNFRRNRGEFREIPIGSDPPISFTYITPQHTLLNSLVIFYNN
jgi:hypothetical protein